MKDNNWRGIAELIGISAIVGSLIFVGVQLRQDRAIALNETAMTIIESRNELSIAIGESADLWLKANDGEALTRAENFKLEKQVFALSASANLEASMRRDLGNTGNVPLKRLATILYENPGARKIWLSLAERDVKYFEKMASDGLSWATFYRNDVLAELAKLDELNQ